MYEALSESSCLLLLPSLAVTERMSKCRVMVFARQILPHFAARNNDMKRTHEAIAEDADQNSSKRRASVHVEVEEDDAHEEQRSGDDWRSATGASDDINASRTSNEAELRVRVIPFDKEIVVEELDMVEFDSWEHLSAFLKQYSQRTFQVCAV